jgi:hypothetical protein
MNLETLRKDARYLVFGDATNTRYSDTDLDRNLNQAYRELVEVALRNCGSWQYRETYATNDFVAGVNKYDLPSDILSIKRVEAKPKASLDDYVRAEFFDPKSLSGSLDAYAPTSLAYDLRWNKITFYYSEGIETVSNGYKVYFSRDITDLANTTDVPDFPTFAHRFLSAKSAYDFCLAEEIDSKLSNLKKMIYGDATVLDEDARGGLIGLIKKHYQTKVQDGQPRISFKRRNFR